MSDKLYALIGKYALLLSIFYFVSYAFNLAVKNIEGDIALTTMALIRATPGIFDLLLNVVAAVIVRRDITKYNARTSYVVFATVLYRPIGIIAFLVFLILEEASHKQPNLD